MNKLTVKSINGIALKLHKAPNSTEADYYESELSEFIIKIINRRKFLRNPQKFPDIQSTKSITRERGHRTVENFAVTNVF